MVNSQTAAKLIGFTLIAAVLFACDRQPTSLYADIPTAIVALSAYSHNAPNYQPVPDSLQLRFNKILRLLRLNVVVEGCNPQPQAEIEGGGERIDIRLDMNNACTPATGELFDVDIHLSPIHPDVFQLVVEARDLDSNAPGQIIFNKKIDVRQLPGL